MGLTISTPVGRLLVKEITEERKTSGGLILAGESDPDNFARLGEIYYNGLVREGHPNRDYSTGNKVYFGKFAGGSVNIDGEKYVSLLESEILAILK